MIHLTLGQINALLSWFIPERPGPLIGSHVIHTGQGNGYVDRWPDPQVVLVETAGNYTLLGNAHLMDAVDLRQYIKGFVETSQAFAPILETAFPNLQAWPRLIFTQQERPAPIRISGFSLRRLIPADVQHLEALDPESTWISKTWGGPQGLAASGYAWGAFINGRLASVACTFFLGASYEDIGVVTEPEYRKMGLSSSCVSMLCRDIWARGDQPSWTTSPDNVASVRVAEKLGFTWQRDDVLYVVDIPIPS